MSNARGRSRSASAPPPARRSTRRPISDRTAARGLLYEWRTRQVRDWRIVWPTRPGTQWQFRGYLSAFKPSAPLADKLTASITIRVAAAPTLA